MKKKFILLIFFLLAILVGHPAWEDDVWSSSIKKLDQMTSIIQENYFQEVKIDDLEIAAVKGILNTLDPHSSFLDPRNFSRLTEEYKGKYYGLGIMIQKQADRLVVITPLEGTPAWRLGIQAGDVISNINGESTKPISSYEAMQRLRGEKGTSVTITIVREGLEEPFDLTIEREEIPLHSVPYAFMLNRETGYIYIRNFSQTTTEEFEEKMKLLRSKGMKNLILDLRGNGGGTFVQSIELADEFLPKGAEIVSIKGRNRYYNREFKAFQSKQYEDMPLVILIDQGSASASEIVSGAVKDNDRGLIVGERSFGKGLVQTVFPLAPHAAISLTTAKYYTPSGRSIQRDYSHIEDYLFSREVPEEEREVKYTAKGRVVLGQGGIDPDYEVSFSYKNITARLLLNGAFFRYARQLTSGETPLGSKSSWRSQMLDSDFTVDERILDDFKAYLEKLKFEYKEKDFEEALDQIKRELEREIISSLFDLEEGTKVFRLTDPVVLKALEVIPEAQDLAGGRSPKGHPLP